MIYGSITILTKPARVYRLEILRDGGARRLANAHVKGGAEIAAGYIGWVEFYVRDNLVPYIGRRAIRYGFKPRGNMGDEDMGKVYFMPNRGRMGSWGNIMGI